MVWDSEFRLARARPGTCWALQDKEREKARRPARAVTQGACGHQPSFGGGRGGGGEQRVVPVDQIFLDNLISGFPIPSSRVLRLAQAVQPGKAGPFLYAQERLGALQLPFRQ